MRVGLEVASAATTRRGLYSGVTRATDENLILVVTETHDLAEARAVLEVVLAADRSDVPAVAQRRELAQLDRAPQPARGPEPRCEIPDWFDDLRISVRRDLVEAERAEERAASARAARATELAEAKEQLVLAERALDPHRPALAAAQADVDDARQRWHAANNEARATRGRQHRAAERESAVAKRDVDAATVRQTQVEAIAAPAREAVAVATKKVSDLRRDLRTDDVFDRWTGPAQEAAPLRALSTALDDWKRWAAGQNLPNTDLVLTKTVLSSATHAGCGELAARLAPSVPAPKPEAPAVELAVCLGPE